MAKGFTSYDVGSLQGATAARIDASAQEAMMHLNFERNPINNPRSAPMTLGIPSHSPPAAFRSQPREAIRHVGIRRSRLVYRAGARMLLVLVNHAPHPAFIDVWYQGRIVPRKSQRSVRR
jgi:hypothetical protein